MDTKPNSWLLIPIVGFFLQGCVSTSDYLQTDSGWTGPVAYLHMRNPTGSTAWIAMYKPQEDETCTFDPVGFLYASTGEIEVAVKGIEIYLSVATEIPNRSPHRYQFVPIEGSLYYFDNLELTRQDPGGKREIMIRKQWNDCDRIRLTG